ncbi:MAG: tetratricopeptide repeat protein [Flavobacteriales bacterium]|nr:tetratricopeptide repeat protein [Flavobacteriales bacterium]
MRSAVLKALMLVHLGGSLRAQDVTEMDSLRRAFLHAHHDSIRTKTLLRMASATIMDSPDSAFAYCLRAKPFAIRSGRPEDEGEVEGWLGYLEEQRGHLPEAIAHYESSLVAAKRAKDRKGIAVVLNNLAAIYKDQGRIAESLAMHEQSLVLREELKDSVGIATSLNNIGLIRFDQGRISEALDRYDHSLRIYEELGDKEGVGTVLHNIAGVYTEQGQHAEALRYLQRALVISEQLADRYAAAYTLDNIGMVLETMGRTDDALSRYEEALVMRKEISDERGSGYSYRNIGGIRLKQGLPAAALDDFKRSMDHFTSSEDKRGRATVLLKMAQAEEALGNAARALQDAERSMVIAKELGHAVLQRDAAELLSRLHRSAGRYEQALEMRDLFGSMHDSVQNTENRRRSMRQEFQYAYDLKEAGLRAEQERKDLLAREQLQKEKNRRNILLLAGIGVLAFAIGLWSRLRFVRRSRTEIQRERDRSESLLLNILPAEVAQELKVKGEADARQIDQVTVLFTDFKGFTAMSERLTPQELVKDIHECFSAFDHIVEAHGIEKIKTIGDAYMAAGGLPTPNSTNASDVVSAAFEIQAFIAAGKARKIALGLPYFEIRIGIHTGPVVAGIVGVRKFAYDIWGDTVNIASRMESSGEPGQINISASTYALIKDTPGWTFTSRGLVEAKGKGKMGMFFVHKGGS